MSFCSSCGAELDGKEAFCPECGEHIQSDSSVETDSGESIDAEPAESDIEPTEASENPDDGIQWTQVGMAGGFAMVPSFVGYIALSLATGGDPVGIVFVLSLPLFTYLLYQRTTAKAMTGGMCYYLAIEFLLSPFVFLLYTIAFANESTSTAAGQAGAAIGGFVITIAAFVIGLPLAIALYLVSRRLDTAENG